jgi:hypothetical protein
MDDNVYLSSQYPGGFVPPAIQLFIVRTVVYTMTMRPNITRPTSEAFCHVVLEMALKCNSG